VNLDRATLTVEEAAEVLRISRSAAYRAVSRGEIPALRVGRSVRVLTWKLRELLGEPR
jgi:excisionase family DNA binding protein